jgi:hypothetical protein
MVVSGKLRGKEVAFVTIPTALSTFFVWFPWPWVKDS